MKSCCKCKALIEVLAREKEKTTICYDCFHKMTEEEQRKFLRINEGGIK
jgi:uncharacterized paraquat-inducible protein A